MSTLGTTILRGVVKLVDAAMKLQSLQVETLADWTTDDVEHFEPYGFTAHPFGESEAVVVHIGADADHPVVLCVADRRYRLTSLAEGEVALYDDQGQVVHLKRTGIVIDTTGDVTITAGGNVDITATGSADLDGASVVLAGGGPAVGRVGDTVEVEIPEMTVVTTPGGPLAVGTLNAAPITLTGTITAGSPKATSG